MKKFITFLIAIAMATTFLAGQANPEKHGFSKDRLMRLNQEMHEYVDNGELSGVQTAIMRHGEIIHFDTYGYADVNSKKELEEGSIWRIYSMTKPIVSVGLMMLYEQGEFQLNDPLSKYIPAMEEMMVHVGDGVTKPAENKIRVVDVLRHTTGFGYGWGPNTYVDSLYRTVNRRTLKDNKAFVEKLAKLPLYYEPGQGWRYSVSTDVAGYLIEVISGMPLDKYLEEKILKPLGMNDTHFEVPEDKKDRFLTNYTTNKEGGLQVIDHPSMSRYTKTVTMFSGGGGMVSTTNDYLRFCQMLLNGGEYEGHRYLSPKTIELMTKDHTKGISHAGGPIALPNDGNGFGLGFSMVTDLAPTGITGSEGSYGWGGAAGTVFRIDPKEDLIFVMMIQLMPYNHLQAREKFQTMVYQALVD